MGSRGVEGRRVGRRAHSVGGTRALRGCWRRVGVGGYRGCCALWVTLCGGDVERRFMKAALDGLEGSGRMIVLGRRESGLM